MTMPAEPARLAPEALQVIREDHAPYTLTEHFPNLRGNDQSEPCCHHQLMSDGRHHLDRVIHDLLGHVAALEVDLKARGVRIEALQPCAIQFDRIDWIAAYYVCQVCNASSDATEHRGRNIRHNLVDGRPCLAAPEGA